VPIPEQGKTRFVKALANAIHVPETEIRMRMRAVGEAGMLPKRTEEFTDRHGVAVILALLAAPFHSEAGRVVPVYAALRQGARRRPKDAPMTPGPVQEESYQAVLAALPSLEVGNLEDVLLDILSDLARDGGDDAAYTVNEIEVTRPPLDAATIRFQPRTGSLPEIAVTFAPLVRGLQDAADRQAERQRNIKLTATIPGPALKEVAPFVVITRRKSIEGAGKTPANRRTHRRAK
jgi:hypothetical protein